jgi:hypothetical protein
MAVVVAKASNSRALMNRLEISKGSKSTHAGAIMLGTGENSVTEPANQPL